MARLPADVHVIRQLHSWKKQRTGKRLKSGKMAATVNIVQEDIVGPSLGQEAIQAGAISFIIALILLMCYMCAIYGIIPGMIANSALFLNIFFIMGCPCLIPGCMTLPGMRVWY